MPYPHLKVLDPSNAVALALETLSTGDLPLICEFEGSVRKIGSVARSARAIFYLSKITGLVYAKDQSTSMEIKGIEDIMEVLM